MIFFSNKKKNKIFISLTTKSTSINIFKKLNKLFNKNLYNKYYCECTFNKKKKIIFNFCNFFKKKEKKNIFIIYKYYSYLNKEKYKPIKIYADFFFIYSKKKLFFTIYKKKNKKNIIKILKIIKLLVKKNIERKQKFFYIIKKNSIKNKKKYVKIYKETINLINKGVILQVQLAKKNIIKTNLNFFDVFIINKDKNINKIYAETIKHSLICFSPEILIKIFVKRKVNTFPIAGTAKRGNNIIDDKFFETKLKNSKKEISEHSMLIDLARNDLNSFSLINTVKVNKKFLILKNKNVQHFVSEVISRFSKKTKIKNIINMISPAGTLSGAPKIKSIEIIKKNEKKMKYSRIFLGGSIGFLNFKKFAAYLFIIIRFSYNFKKYMNIEASSGITIKSKIKEEYEELNRKIKIFLKK